MSSRPATSFIEFLERFPNEAACHRHIAAVRFGSALECPQCDNGQRLSATGKARQIYCPRCKVFISPTSGTLASHSKMPLWDWFYLLLLLANRTAGISVDHLARQLGVSRLASYRMLSLARLHISQLPQRKTIGGPGIIVEIDETWLPNILPTEPDTRGGAIVFGIYSQEGVITQVIPDRRADTMIPLIQASVLPGSIVVTDAHRSYSAVASCGYRHVALNHKRGEWARDGLAMARIESYWTSLKYFLRSHNRTLKRETLPLYLVEHAFRHNLRQRGENVFEALIARFPTIDRSQLPKGAAPARERSPQ